MNLQRMLAGFFPEGHDVSVAGHVIGGTARLGAGNVAVLGTTAAAAVDHTIALALSRQVLETVAWHPGRATVMLVDTCGQALSREAELLCLNRSFAHLASCIDLARRRGHRSVSVVTAEAVSGGFLSFGLMADRAYALANASVRVMDLRAMARVMKVEHERLVTLAGTSPIFAPGAHNFWRMGGLDAIWDEPSAQLLEAALDRRAESADDLRVLQGQARGGRAEAARIHARMDGV
jgi:malonate decarboxylase gamma subunit